MMRDEVLALATQLITQERAKQYGDAREMFGRIAELWSALIRRDLSAHEVALMLAAMKLARAAYAPMHADSWVDAAGYIALGAEMAGE